MSAPVIAENHEISELVVEILRLRERLAKLRRSQPRSRMPDYEFALADGSKISLRDMFGDKTDLILIHNMGEGCVYCTLWADGLNAFTEHLESRAAFWVVSPAPAEKQRKFAKSRSWRFKMASSEGNSFNKDAGFEDEKGAPWPGVSTFELRSDGVYRVASSFFGPGDSFCSVWPLLDLLADGASGWEPKYKY